MQDEERKKPRILPEPPKVSPIDPIIAANMLPHQGRGEIQSDVLGSYTGLTKDGDRPEQDADDL